MMMQDGASRSIVHTGRARRANSGPVCVCVRHEAGLSVTAAVSILERVWWAMLVVRACTNPK